MCTFTHALQNRSIIQELSPLQPSSVQCILYCEGVWDWGACAYPHFTLLLTLSQFAAIYGLFLFRHELSAELEPIRPWPKLVCVKVIVFATFWLGAFLHVAQVAGLIMCVACCGGA